MNKCPIKYILFCFSFLFISCNSKVDWTKYFTSDKTTPFGTYILRKELNDIFFDSYITDTEEPLNHSINNFYPSERSEIRYIFINSYLIHDEAALEHLIQIAENGASIFISIQNTPSYFNQLLEIETNKFLPNDFVNHYSLSISENSQNSNYPIDKGAGFSYINSYNPETTEVLGNLHFNDTIEPNFVRIRFGSGYFYLHTEPIAFTNYYMLENENYNYVTDVFSFVDDGEILWNNNRFQTINATKKTEGGFFDALSFIQNHNSLMTALYLLITMGLLYLIFNSQRKQRIVPIRLPYKNYTLDFAKTLAELYRNHPDHSAMVQYKINFFFEQIRIKYNITTKNMDNDFENLLSAKSGVDELTCSRLTNLIKQLKSKKTITKDDYIKLNTIIESFNKKSNIYDYGKS